jgi:hypothetical protein
MARWAAVGIFAPPAGPLPRARYSLAGQHAVLRLSPQAPQAVQNNPDRFRSRPYTTWPIRLIRDAFRTGNAPYKVERDFPAGGYFGRAREAGAQQNRVHALVLENGERELGQGIVCQKTHVFTGAG